MPPRLETMTTGNKRRKPPCKDELTIRDLRLSRGGSRSLGNVLMRCLRSGATR